MDVETAHAILHLSSSRGSSNVDICCHDGGLITLELEPCWNRSAIVPEENCKFKDVGLICYIDWRECRKWKLVSRMLITKTKKKGI